MRSVRIDKLIVRAANRSDCAHGCRYCPLRRKQSPITLERYAVFVERVRAWLAQQNQPLHLYHALGYHHDHDDEDLALLRRLDGDQPIRGITLGGLPWRSDPELETWLRLLKAHGLETVHATFGGAEQTHDRWNNKTGNYELLLRTLRIAGDLGIRLGQRILVGQSTLESLERLVEDLDALPSHDGDWRYAMPFFYQARRQKPQPHVEADRIDEAMRDHLPEPILRSWGERTANLSEREWIERLAGMEPEVDRATLVIRLNARTIDELERRDIADIVEDLSEQTRLAYRLLPSVKELTAQYGESSNTKIYASSRCLETKWLDGYRDSRPEVAFDQSLTHCWFGG